MKYELTTLRDVFDKVPADRIEDCLLELAVTMKQAKAMRDLLSCAGTAVSGEPVSTYMEWPERITWTDDGKKTIRLTFNESDGSGNGLVLETKLGDSK